MGVQPDGRATPASDRWFRRRDKGEAGERDENAREWAKRAHRRLAHRVHVHVQLRAALALTFLVTPRDEEAASRGRVEEYFFPARRQFAGTETPEKPSWVDASTDFSVLPPVLNTSCSARFHGRNWTRR